MKFMFFTFGGHHRWEDVYNYQNWIIQKNVNSKNYRLIDPFSIRRHSGSFEQCRDLLMEYVAGYELDEPYDDSIIIIPGFGYNKKSMEKLTESLKNLPANIIVFNNASIKMDLNYHSYMLTQFLKNLNNNGKISFITTSTGGLILRKMISDSNNYRNYNIKRILEINPMNTGSDFAELLAKYPIFTKIIGPMIKDITPKKLFSLSKLPRDIEHGLLFCPLSWKAVFRKILSRYDSFPITSRPTEESYAKIIKKISQPLPKPLDDSEVLRCCRQFITTGDFGDKDVIKSKKKSSSRQPK